MDTSHIDKKFDKIDYTRQLFGRGEYEACTFTGCDLSNANMSDSTFLECAFVGCNLSMAQLGNTALRDVTFTDCKMLGLHFENCNEFGFSVSFDNCILNHSSFYRTKLKKTTFRDSKLQDVDFSECDLGSAVFQMCDLLRATFEKTILEKADLRTSFNYSIDPENNRIKKAKFSLAGAIGLLDKYDIDIEE
jgi:fluoroquinolone resistance protein